MQCGASKIEQRCVSELRWKPDLSLFFNKCEVHGVSHGQTRISGKPSRARHSYRTMVLCQRLLIEEIVEAESTVCNLTVFPQCKHNLPEGAWNSKSTIGNEAIAPCLLIPERWIVRAENGSAESD